MGPLWVKVRPGGAVAVPPYCACGCDKPVQLTDPETAFLSHPWQHFLIMFIDPCLWVKRNLCVRVLTNLHGILRNTVACQCPEVSV